MNCLDNIIGVAEKCTTGTAPVSGLFVNDLPHITISLADAGVNDETESGIKLIENKINFSQRTIAEEIRNFLLPKIKTNSIVENDNVGFYRDDLKAVASEAGQLKGIQLRIDEFPYLKLYVHSITLQLDAAVTTDIKVFDLITDTLLDTISITTVADVPTEVIVQKEYLANKQRLNLLFAIDAGVAGTFQTTTSPVSNNDCFDCGRRHHTIRNPFVFTKGVKIDDSLQKIQRNLKGIAGTNGLSIHYGLSCHLEPFICNMANVLAWPLLHKVGAELMLELQLSNRLNSIVLIYDETNEFLQQYFDGKYRESMDSILDTIVLPQDMCFTCNQQISTAVHLPA